MPLKFEDYEVLALFTAKARVALCLCVLFSVYVDPSTGGLFGIGIYVLITLIAHFVYGAVTYFVLGRGPVTRTKLQGTAALDILFAAILAFFTEGETSPAFAMFLFAIIAAGCWADFRSRVIVTLLTVVLYLLAIVFSGVAVTHPLLMRAVYLGIAGYLLDFFGREREKAEARVRELEALNERHTIARSLHDGFMQALASISLRLENCRDMLCSNQTLEALSEIKEIQIGVSLEYNEVSNYVRVLAQDDRSTRKSAESGDANEFSTEFKVETRFVAQGPLVEHTLQILLESVRNTRQHARARSAEIRVHEVGPTIRIAIDDDGVGFAEFDARPWTIASRVAEFGGHLAIRPGASTGAHLEIELPATRVS
jgi:signal transduction histidine kinase